MPYAYTVTGSRLKHKTVACCNKVNIKQNHTLNIQYNKKLSWGSPILLLRAIVLNFGGQETLIFIDENCELSHQQNAHLHTNQYLNEILGVQWLQGSVLSTPLQNTPYIMLFPSSEIFSGSKLPATWSLDQGSAACYVQGKIESILGFEGCNGLCRICSAL